MSRVERLGPPFLDAYWQRTRVWANELAGAQFEHAVDELLRVGRPVSALDFVDNTYLSGTFGIEWATPIPLPEQTLLLGLGAGAVKPVWNAAEGAFLPQMQAQLTLSFDHRVLDGGGAGRLLHRISTLLVSPEGL